MACLSPAWHLRNNRKVHSVICLFVVDDDDKEITTYRPFKDCDELIETYLKKKYVKTGKSKELLELPTIWVRHKNQKDFGSMITNFKLWELKIDDSWKTLELMFEEYTFLDGSVCGVIKCT